MHDLSADYVLTGRGENLYWQYLVGMKFLDHVFSIDPSGMTRWRHRIGGAGTEEQLKETIEAGSSRR